MRQAGILGIGVYLPPEVRTNDWWSADVVDGWRAQRAQVSRPALPETLTPGARRVLAAMSEQRSDPFLGTRERRIMPSSMSLQDMEAEAATRAMAEANIGPSDVGLLLTNRVVPDFLLGNPACDLHERLGLARECTSAQIEAAAHSFLVQLSYAEAQIACGRVDYALLVQSCAPSSTLVDWDDLISPLFGDAATAVVVGPVRDGRGVIANVNFTDGRYPRTVIASVPGGTWYGAGVSKVQEADHRQLFELMLQTADVCSESIKAVLQRAQRAPSDVTFLAMHQGTPWLRRVILEESGLVEVKTVDLFPETAYIFACTIPATLGRASTSGLLVDGNLVVCVGGGTGHIFGATAVVWGR